MPAKCAPTPKKPTRHFADGGVIGADGLTDAQRAKINGARSSLGISDVSPSPQNPDPKPQPQAQAIPQQQGITTGIIGLLKGRAAAIDKAAGYAQGGIIRNGISSTISQASGGYGKRIDGTEKGNGYFGPLKTNDGRVMTELSADATLPNGNNINYPLISPNQSFKDLSNVLTGGSPSPEMHEAAYQHAIKQGMQGKTPYASETYARGGIVRGKGTPTSDSVPMNVNGQDVNLSDTEAVLPGKTVQALGGPKAVESLIEATNGKPPVKDGLQEGGKYADGMVIDENDPRLKPFSAAVPSLGSGLSGMSRTIADSGIAPYQAVGPGRDANGVITADSAAASSGNPMTRSGGVSGGIDMAGVNGILQRENIARAGLIDSMVKANGGNGIAIIGDGSLGSLPGGQSIEDYNAEKTKKWRQDDLLRDARNGNQVAVGAALHANAQTESEAMRTAGALANEQARGALVQRGQDLGLQRATDRNDVITRGQDVRAGTAADRIASNESIAGARIADRSGPTLSQQRGNAEIDAARERISGMDAAEIKLKTANFTSTGRENPDFDPTLAKAVSLANRRKVGDDQHFDERQQAQQPAANQFGFDRKEVASRFRSERAMDRYKLGNDTENGVEVLDASGKIVGHYR